MKKIMLLVSDNMYTTLRSTLNTHYHILPCSDPADILLLQPDVVILDLFLLGRNGFTFLKNNVQYLPSILVLTPYTSDTLLRELSDLGVGSVIRIPFNIRFLENQLQNLLTKKYPSR